MKSSSRALLYTATLGAAHGVADAISGFAIAVFALSVPLRGILGGAIGFDPGSSFVNNYGDLVSGALGGLVGVIALYNLVAFALQPAAGWLVDRFCSHERVVLSSLYCMGLGLILFLYSPLAGLALIATGSAFFHASAGALATRATPGQSIGPGFFTGPGVMGLALGTVAGLQSFALAPTLLVLLTTCGILLTVFPLIETKLPTKERITRATTLLLVTTLGLGIALRSAVWTSVGQAYSGMTTLLVLGAAAMLGKLLGGFVADYVEQGTTAIVGTLLAGACFFFPSSLLLVALGVLLLQSSTPIILKALVESLPHLPALGSGLAQGFFIALGSLFALILPAQYFFGSFFTILPLFLACCAFATGVAHLRLVAKHENLTR